MRDSRWHVRSSVMELILGYRRAASNFPSCKKFRANANLNIGWNRIYIYISVALWTLILSDRFRLCFFLGYSVGLEAEECRDTRLFPHRTRRKLWNHFDLYSSVIRQIQILHFHWILFPIILSILILYDAFVIYFAYNEEKNEIASNFLIRFFLFSFLLHSNSQFFRTPDIVSTTEYRRAAFDSENFVFFFNFSHVPHHYEVVLEKQKSAIKILFHFLEVG